jgi:hypothetical protein
MNSYQRLVGAGADAKELEYVSALHQTCMPSTRASATISSLDIQRYLVSRHGLLITPHQAKEIVQGLGGTRVPEPVYVQVHEKLRAQAQAEFEAEQERQSSKKRGGGSRASNLFGSLKQDNSSSNSSSIKPKLHALWTQKGRKEAILEEEQRRQQQEEVEGGDKKDDDADTTPVFGLPAPSLEYLDIIQWTSILLIPTLVRYAAAGNTEETNHPPEDIPDSEAPSLDPQPPELIDTVWKLLANSMGKVEGSPALTPEFVKELLTSHGEYERAQDEALIQEMIQVAGSELFTKEAFLRALTVDVEQWKAGQEDEQSTYVHDVFGTDGLSKLLEETGKKEADKKEEASRDVESSPSSQQDEKQMMGKTNSLRIIDSVVDSYASFFLLLNVWVFYLAQAGMYSAFLQAADFSKASCSLDGETSFGCTVVSTIWTWLALACMLTVMGLIIVTSLTIGNHPTKRSPMRLFVAMVIVALFTAVPMLALSWYKNNKVEEPYDAKEAIVMEENFDGTQILTFSLGILAFCNYTWHFFLAVIEKNKDRFDGLYSYLKSRYFYLTSHDRGTARVKQAGTRKVNRLLTNAYKLHHPISEEEKKTSFRTETEAEATFRNFVLYGEEKEDCASFFWTWKQIWTGRLFDTDGIWIPTRVLIFQTAQVAFGLFLSTTYYIGVEYVADVADQAVEDLPESDIIPDWVYDLVPTGRQVRLALYPGELK